MNFTLYATGAVDQSSKRSGCGVVLVTAHNGKSLRRTMAYSMGQTTANAAALMAVRLALLAIKSEFRTAAVVVRTDNPYAHSVLQRDDDGYKIQPRANAEAVAELRQTYEAFPNIEIVFDRTKSPMILECLDLAKRAAATGTNSDSGTVPGDEHGGVAGATGGDPS